MRSDIVAAHGTILLISSFICLTFACLGSVQSVVGVNIPDDLKAVFHTAFELDPCDPIGMAVDRPPFIDQSQSFSLFVAQPTPLLVVSSSSTFLSRHHRSTSTFRWTFNFTHGDPSSRLAHTMYAAKPRLSDCPSASAARSWRRVHRPLNGRRHLRLSALRPALATFRVIWSSTLMLSFPFCYVPAL